jgi:hypothetical protein
MRLPGIRIFTLSVALTVITAINVSASGPAGIYAVIDKVVFEPNEQSPERIQLWGVFAFVSGSIKAGTIFEDAPAQRGYLYFNMPADYTAAQKETVKKEWADLKSVAGTPQAVAFGDLFYIRAFSDVNDGNVYASGSGVGIRVRSDTPSASALAPYSINIGIVKLPATGNHETVVRRLKKGMPTK